MRVLRGMACTAITAFGLAGLAAPASATAATHYVALGDSYSSGVGAGAYDGSSCKRSANAYPPLWADGHDAASFEFVACSGARTQGVLDSQVSALAADTTHVTVSVGGNDAGFADVMTTCNTSSDQGCLDRVEQAKAFVRNELPARLDGVYGAIEDRAPSAEVYVLGYPHMYELDGTCSVGLSEVKREAINGASDVLNDTIAARARAAGYRFVDGRAAFDNHEICSGDRWLHSVTWPVDESYHPTAEGQSLGYLAALNGVTG